jgi:hypothetical protein
MSGETNLKVLLKSMNPILNKDEYVFLSLDDFSLISPNEILMSFREEAGKTTLIIRKELADSLRLSYEAVFSWISLKVHSSLVATGFTGAFAKALAEEQISCNVVAGFYHDHLFVLSSDTAKALKVLTKLAE